ncbi:response regulator transcription factor [Planotetraspora phitsanulokensis]|uniref:DNA-binding response regulator n=1 Tax=Planotetraspora phitsanulokensis TaxID=575192 RepID=A0A8J3U0P9_9ACTN|nr:response regulator transcription factor [Planotetraspora phitsanulokensis]GII35762.1 DNA-binding response regulator [Planotetraspora phitsanulokensis]
MIRVVIADDQALVRTGFRMILDETDDIRVAGEAADGLAVLSVAAQETPDVVLMDVRMPGIDGIEATRRLCSAETGPHVIILTTFDLDEYVYAGLHAGAAGFLLKDTLAADLVTAIRNVAAGQNVAAPSVTSRLVKHFVGTATRPANGSGLALLTSRERDVLSLIAQGMSNHEIADQLIISEGTVKTHVSRILAKLQLRDRIHAVIYAYETGLAN